MAYISTEQVAEKRKKINAVCKKYGVRATIRRDWVGSITIVIRSGKINFLNDAFHRTGEDKINTYEGGICVNQYHFKDHFLNDSESYKFLREIVDIAEEGNHDNSDIMTDYFDVGWYYHINIGTWDKPYFVKE